MIYTLNTFQHYLAVLYKQEGWDKLPVFTNSNFLLEEAGELLTELQLGNRENAIDELGDILQVLLAIANQYELKIEDSLIEDTSSLNTSNDAFLSLFISLSDLAREVRRREIGRHSHSQKETMNPSQQEALFSNVIHLCLSRCQQLGNTLSTSFPHIIEGNILKMKERYV